MPEVQLVKVISCNFQDPKHQVTNLLRGNFGKWLCPLPRKNMSMEAVFMMERACVISGINIGNCGSAFVTVSVSHYGSSEFETLLPSSVLMDRQQTKSGSGKTSVLMFSRDKFCENVRENKWGIIKITCTQPFDTHVPFGLSFIHIITFEKDTVFADTSGKENRIMAKRNIYNKASISRPQSDVIQKVAAASPRSLELMKACMNLHNSDNRGKISETVDCAKEMPLRENVSRTEKLSNGLSGTDSRRSKCPICCGSYEVTEIEAHAAQCTGVSNSNSAIEENDEVMCPVCKCKFSSEYIASHADACAEKRLDSTTKSAISSPQAGRHKSLKFVNSYEEQGQKTPPNKEEKDCDIKFRHRVIAFLDTENVLAKYMKHITIGELRRLYEQTTKESLQSHEIKKFAAVVRSYLRAYSDSEGKSSSSKVSDNQDVIGRHPVCRRNLLSLEDSANAQNRDDCEEDDFISRNVIIHASPTTPTKRIDSLHTPKRKNLESGPFRRKRLANGMHSSDATYDGSNSEPNTVHTILEDGAHMVQCHLCEEFFSIADIGNHSSTCIVPADIHQLNSEREICPICDELIAKDCIEQHAALCAENKFG
ncbi:uncharacterized protein LOC126153520 [Schistocerca cancellata]|uniref:uncharacterized protein LOC126153520 n=1 Tax=Schistocerca cancellata TaxID=274614 RepID=UPI0021197FA3|nr:uncharacterized protein LOC126153520 [Schistocerca cancellata]